eukprot:scaffold20169_cov69-Phaeocystis_antarctica.AAC.6
MDVWHREPLGASRRGVRNERARRGARGPRRTAGTGPARARPRAGRRGGGVIRKAVYTVLLSRHTQRVAGDICGDAVLWGGRDVAREITSYIPQIDTTHPYTRY